MVCAKQDQSSAVLVTPGEQHQLQQNHLLNNQQTQSQQELPHTTDIVLFKRTNDQPIQQNQHQQQEERTTTINEQQIHQSALVVNSQMLKTQYASLVKLLESDPITMSAEPSMTRAVAGNGLLPQNISPNKNQKNFVGLQKNKKLLQQQLNRRKTNKGLKITHIPIIKAQYQKKQMKNRKLDRKFFFQKYLYQKTIAVNECEISSTKVNQRQSQQKDEEVVFHKNRTGSVYKVENESDMDKNVIDMLSNEKEYNKTVSNSNSKIDSTGENIRYYEHFQCPWKKIRFAYEFKQRQQEQQTIEERNPEQLIMRQQQKREIVEPFTSQPQIQLNICQEQRQTKRESTSSVLDNSTTRPTIASKDKKSSYLNRCNLNKSHCHIIQEPLNEEIYAQQQHQIDGVNDEIFKCTEPHRQMEINCFCQEFDDNSDTCDYHLNDIRDTNTTILRKDCKLNGFFRRSIQQKIQYRPCTKNQQCSILRINRNRCQYCRLKKCIAVGMSRDAVRFGRVPKREKARILAAMQQSTQNRGQQRALATELDDQPRLLSAVLRAHLDTCEFTKEKVLDMRQKARDCPSFSMPTLLACPLNPAPELQSEQEFSQRFAHIIRGVIDFAGMIPGFQLLTQDDKFTLLKAGLFDALFVRLICMFDSSINSIICLNGQVMRRDAIQNGANARFLVDSTFNFAERINSMNLSDAEIGLFCAIVLITPDRPGLRNIELVEKMYSRLKSCLQTIINKNRPDQPDFIIKLLDTMPDLRTLSTLHTEKLVVFRTEHKEMLRQQMWSIDDESLASNSKSPPALSTSALSSSWIGDEMDVQLEVMSVSDMTSTYNRPKSQLGYVSSTAGDIEGYTTKKDDALHSHNAVPHISEQHFPFMSRCTQQQQPSASTLASSAPLLAATLSSGSNMHSQPRNRANSGSSGDSASSDLDLIVVSHAHLTQNGLTITPIARSAPQQVQQMHHHLTGATTVNRYRKLDSPTDSGIESGNEKNECGGKAASSGGSSSCSSPRSSVDDASDCPETNAILSSTARCMQPVSLSSVPVTSIALYSPQNALKRQIVEDMPVLKRVLQAPPLYDTNSLMDEAYKPHKKFRAMRHREFETTEADASCSTSSIHSLEPATIITTQFSREKTPPPVIPATPSVPSESPNANGHLQVHMPHPHALNQTSSSSFLSSTHSVLAKSLLAEPHMTPEQIKRSDIIQNYIMRENSPSASAGSTTPSRLGTHSPNTTPHPTVVGDSFTSQLPHEFPQNHCLKHHKPTSINQSNTSNFSHALIESPLAPPVRWKTPTSHSHVHNGIGLTSVITTSTNTNQLLGNNKHPQYTKSPTLALSLVELQVNIADSQQPLNLSKKSPSPPPSNLQTLVAAATTVQQQHHQQQKRYTPTGPTVIFEDMSTPTSSSLVMVAQATADISPFASQVSPTSTPPPSLHHKVLLEA